MIQRAEAALSQLYESDETAWLEAMAELIRQDRCGELDYPHLGEYLSDMARRDRRVGESLPATPLAHVLEWEPQPAQLLQSMRASIVQHREAISRRFVASGPPKHTLPGLS